MTNFVDVVEVNPIVFVKQIVEQIAKGFYVQNTIAGCPVMMLPYQIRMFDTKPAVKNTLHADVHTAVVEGYDAMLWLLDVQDVALQGFDMDLTGAVVDNFKSVTMRKATTVSPEAVSPAVEAPAKPKRAKSKPTEQGE
jgi:hypothetical protein